MHLQMLVCYNHLYNMTVLTKDQLNKTQLPHRLKCYTAVTFIVYNVFT